MKLGQKVFALIGVVATVGAVSPSLVSALSASQMAVYPSTSKRTPKNFSRRSAICDSEAIACISQQSLRWVRPIQASIIAAQNDPTLKSDLYALEVKRSEFLQQIATQSGLSPRAMITVCQLGGECRHLRGNERLDSPASLIKIPIALVLLHKSDVDRLNLDTKTLVSFDNFTEDKGDIGVGEELALKTLLSEMISNSSNIATNQLIDYLGWDYMNHTLHDLGYQSTEVNFKVMGEEIMPAAPGEDANRLTSDELTKVMLDTYGLKYPSAKLLVEALQKQSDREIGYAALQNTRAQWLGEKTGQTSDVLGTTVAMRIADKDYIVTVIDDNSAGVEGMRDCIFQIAKYIHDREQL
jgi:beta-lactamase class A